jgi:glycosyltransferase involved in cell wall biosynthesis
MKILYVSQYFPPEMGAPAARVSELARHWVQSGHEVTVLTGFPNHPTGVVPPEYRAKFRRLICRERIDDIEVVRTWLVPLPNRKPYERILNYTSFWLSSCLTGTLLCRPDVIVATSPQLLVGLTGWWLGLVKRVPFILEVRDLWPESLTASGVGTPDSQLVRVLRRLSSFLYRSSNHIVVVTNAFRENLVKTWGLPEEKITVVENGVETDLFTPHGSTSAVKSAIGLDGRFIVSCIGTLGLAHGLDMVLQAAAELKDTFPDILFLFVGEGADRERLLAITRERNLTNVRFLPQQPREKIPAFIRASDVCLVLLRKAEVFKTVIPTKMLEFMACARSVILGVDGQARHILQDADAGIFIDPEDLGALVQTIIRLYHDPALRLTLGCNGTRYIVEHLSRKVTAEKYVHTLDKVVLEWKQHRGS